MSNEKSILSGIFKLLVVLIAVIVVVALQLNDTNDTKSVETTKTKQAAKRPAKPLPYDGAVTRLNRLVKGISWTRDPVARRASLDDFGTKQDLTESLPDIDEYPIVVEPQVTETDVVVEIFVTTVRSKKGRDGRMNEVAEAFNAANLKLDSGERARVRIRKIASGTGYQYIASQKHMPDAFTPVHHLWIEMVAAKGIPVTATREYGEKRRRYCHEERGG